MCFTPNNISIIKVAKQDIECYKILSCRTSTLDETLQLVPYYYSDRLVYKLGVLNTLQDSLLNGKGLGYQLTDDVEGGVFHSFIPAKKKYESYGILVRCVIPKGSLYAENDIEYVSNQIIVTHVYYPKKRRTFQYIWKKYCKQNDLDIVYIN